jgi:two-component system response regulator DesR
VAVGLGLKALVQAMPGLRVVGLCTRGERALAQAAETAPDVALVDADLPGLCSAAVIRLLRWRLPRTRVVALGTYAERRWLALAAGAHQFVLKDAGYDAIQAAIVHEGERVGKKGIDVRKAIDGGADATGVPAEGGHKGKDKAVNLMMADAIGRPGSRGERVQS